ncbi:MAG: DNA cytosine methyltransferase [Bacteroidales bacterium]|nr:DNA cytosine methyltransferase [Bacteroidales bacterium]
MKKIIPFDDYNLRFHPGADFVGTVLPTWGNFALTNGWKLIEKDKDMGKIYRIRKLTSRECFRLMGVNDADVDKIKAAGISESQQYKMAGNSIVVQVLEGIFTQMFRKDEDALF